MSINSSSAVSSLPHCMDSVAGYLIGTAFIFTKFGLVLPLSILIFYVGHRRWRLQRSFATASHSDVFTYHAVALELIFVFGVIVYCCGLSINVMEVIRVGGVMCSISIPGQMSFHVLTCVERYLAVVHPVTYMRLKQSGGVRIRNVSIGGAWLGNLGWMVTTAVKFPELLYTPLFCLLVPSLVIVSFCSVWVLCVLIRPGPGDVGGDRERVDQSKQRAVHTVTAIMGVLWLFFAGWIVVLALDKSKLLSYDAGCVVLSSGNWLSLPGTLVLPLLFLHKTGKLLCCHCSNR